MLQTTIIAMARIAIHQFVWALRMAEPERMSPMHIIIGPVTTGGKNLITLFVPKAAMSPASTK